VGEIAGDDGELGIGVVMVDIGDGRVEPRSGVEPIEPQAGANEVGIGDLDQLHDHLRGWCRGYGRRATARAKAAANCPRREQRVRLRSFRQQTFHVPCHLRKGGGRLLRLVDDGLQVIVDGIGDLERVLSREGVPARDDVLLPDGDQVVGVLLTKPLEHVLVRRRNGAGGM
jgi:hypothetical protein